jgi:predicted DNA-binding protein (MmcQ/YjbR family)
MNADSIRKYCLSFPHATENLQWEDELCFKVNGKIFTILGLDSVPQHICFKCSPEKFAELCELEDIRPAPYVGRYKWVLLGRLDALYDEELQNCIRQSYEMVSSKAKGDRATGRAGGRKAKKPRAKRRSKSRRG